MKKRPSACVLNLMFVIMNWMITSMDKSILWNIVWCYQNNLISKNFNKLSLVKPLVNQDTGLNALEHYQTPSWIFSWGCIEIAAAKPWKTSRKTSRLQQIQTPGKIFLESVRKLAWRRLMTLFYESSMITM